MYILLIKFINLIVILITGGTQIMIFATFLQYIIRVVKNKKNVIKI